jgi:hypothetical protein
MTDFTHYYKENDLSYIFVRAKNASGKWDNLDLNQITDKQWIDWLKDHFHLKVKNNTKKPWSKTEKIDVLNHIAQDFQKPCVCMLKH